MKVNLVFNKKFLIFCLNEYKNIINFNKKGFWWLVAGGWFALVA